MTKPIKTVTLCLLAGLCAVRVNAVVTGSDLAKSHFKGGLAVLSGMRDASLALELGASSNSVVQMFVAEEADAELIRDRLRQAGLYGRVTATVRRERFLPYADGMVNLLVLDESATFERAEINRVLAPLGSAVQLRGGAIATVTQKPWPDNVDVWTHSRRDSTGNAVSSDQLAGPPRFTRWEALPRWNHGTKTSGMVTEGGRIFYILSDSHFATAQALWYLIARDGANGIELWRHPLPEWEGAGMGKKVGPAQVNRRLVALDGRVYAPLTQDGAIAVIDAVTGCVVRTLAQTAGCEEFLVSEGVLVALLDESGDTRFWTRLKRPMKIAAVDPVTGRTLWQHDSGQVLPMTLTADDRRVVFHDGASIQSLDLQNGTPLWSSAPTGQKVQIQKSANPDSPGAEESTIVLAPQFAPTMVMYNGVVAFAGGRRLNVVSAEDGRELWRAPYASSNYSAPVDLFGFNDALWGPDIAMNLWRPLDDDLGFKAFDPRTGEVKKTVSGKFDYRFQHHRCHQMKVVGHQIIGARAGIEFLDTDTGSLAAHHWTRGSCYFGVLPANGLLYVPPHNCACYARAKLSGLLALSAAEPLRTLPVARERRLERGPAYGRAQSERATSERDWPTYRRDAARSGVAGHNIGEKLLLGWETELGGSLTAPVAAGGRVFVACADAHRLFALDALSGRVLWARTLGGRIDSPPSIYGELVLCGCRDGSVYALRASDGALVWRFQAAPEERVIVSRGQLESTWPVFGSVLVVRDTAYFAAGKTSYLDGGIRLFGLNPASGEKVFERVLFTRDETGAQLLDDESVDGYLNDILSCDGERIYMRHQAFDLLGSPVTGRFAHLHGADGYLSDNTTSRLQWVYAPSYSSPHQGAFFDIRLSRALFPSGRILVEYDDLICGFGQNHYAKMSVDPGGSFALFAMPKKIEAPLELTAKEYRQLALTGAKSVNFHWWKESALHVWALAGTPDVLFAGGAKSRDFVTPEALAGREEGVLLAVSPQDGSVLAEMYPSAMPVWDGMAIAGDTLYVSMANGRLAALWPEKSGRGGESISQPAMLRRLPPLQVQAVAVSSVDELIAAIRDGSDGTVIEVAEGSYALDASLELTSGMTLRGAGMDKTTITHVPQWRPSVESLPDPEMRTQGLDADAYLIRLAEKAKSVTIAGLTLTGPQLHGAVFGVDNEHLLIHHVRIKDFLWSGIRTFSMRARIHDCEFIDAGGRWERGGVPGVKGGITGGGIFAIWMKDSEIFNNRFVRTQWEKQDEFYGIKVRQAKRTRVHHNTIEVNFSMEFPFENDEDVEIDHNICHGTISLPKYAGGPVPASGRTFHIHHNLFYDTYALEFVRNGIEINRNLFLFDPAKDHGNLISGFGKAPAAGPALFHNNLVRNPGRGVIWINEPYSNLEVRNNHVKTATTATPRTEGLFGFNGECDFSTVRIADNIIECEGQSRPLFRNAASYGATVENNRLVNVSDAARFKNEQTGRKQGLEEPLSFKCGVRGEVTVDGWSVH